MARSGLRVTPGDKQLVIVEREIARRNRERWVRTRLRCLLKCDETKTMEETARIYEVARSTLAEWICKFRQSGILMYGDEASFEQSETLCRPWTERGVGHEVKSFPTRKRQESSEPLWWAQTPNGISAR